jgi:Transglutaminase-like superfamily
MTNRLIQSIYLSALTGLSIWFLWPIYEDSYMFVSVGVGLAVGLAIAWFQASRKLSPLSTILAILVSFILLSLPLTNPRALGNPSLLLSGWLEALVSPIDSWKQLVTVELPVGTYHALLAPAFLSYLIAGVVMGWVVFGPITRFWAAAYPIVGLVILAISFGSATVPGDFNFFGQTLPIATPLVAGTLLFLLLLVYLNWGSRAARRSTLTKRPEVSAPLLSGWQRKLRRNLAALAVVAVAVIGSGIFMQASGMSGTRIVLRTDIDKLKDIQRQTSPLSTYRKYFADSKLFGETLLTYTVKGAPDRIRIATMPFYDGDNFTVAPTTQTGASNSYYFERVPSELPASASGKEQTFTVQLGKLDALWLPLPLGARKITFVGSKAAQLADGLYVNRETSTGAVVGLSDNDSTYTVTYNRSKQPEPTSIKSSSATINTDLIPESLTTWIDNQKGIADDASGIVQLASILIHERGYLSHSFVAPTATAGETNWVDSLNNYEFFQSNAGHNIARISTMFSDINAREQDANSTKSKNLISTAGDDEQFATAIALIASAKGYAARVVVGFRTNKLADLPGVETCKPVDKTYAACKGANLSAWAEIRENNGPWLAIDSTPQFNKKMNLVPIGTAYVPNPTTSGEDDAKVLPPAKATPSSDSECRKHPNSPDCNPDDWWSKFLGILTNYVVPALETLLVVGIFVAPFAAVLLMKRNRRRSRFEAEEPEVRVIGAWEEYVDLIVDNGGKLPRSETRKELAALYASENMDELAELADLAAFSPRMPDESEIDRAWQILNEKTESVYGKLSKLQKIKLRLSLRSFVRNVNPKEEFVRLQNTLNFSQGKKAAEGSSVEGLTIEFKRQLRSVFKKK